MRILLIGLGFVGEPLAKALHAAGHHVCGITHSESSRERLSACLPIDVRQADVACSQSLHHAIGQDAPAVDWVIHCASSGRGGSEQYRRVYRDGVRHLLALCPQARLLFTSSTSVYAQTDGSWVGETSAADPDRETGKILREAEDLVLQAEGIVARLAGIYGPGRSFILLKYLNETAVIEGDGGRFLNQAHVDDIVQGLQLLLESGARGIYNVVDTTPQTQRMIYQFLAEHFDGSLPPQAPPDYERKRGWTHKRVSNEKLRQEGWIPRYPSFQTAVREDLALVPSIREKL